MGRRPTALLRTRAWLFGALLFCVYCALPSSMKTWGPPGADRDWFDTVRLIVFDPFVIFMCACIAIRSPFVADRVVFGVTGGTLAVDLLVQAFSPEPTIQSIIRGSETVMWVGAAGICLALIVSGPQKRNET